MSKNPFKTPRNETLIKKNLEEKIQQWGKVKFKPRFSKNHKSPVEHKGKIFDKTTSKSTAKFNVIAKNARPENATPWEKFKNEIILRDKERPITSVDMKSEEAKKLLRQREHNYRKSMMLEKMKEPTIWEDFQDDKKEKRGRSTKKSKGITKNVGLKNKYSKDIISPEVLRDFDSKTLTAEQNNKLRRLITKATTNFKGTTLRQVVNNLKNQKRERHQSYGTLFDERGFKMGGILSHS